VRSIRALVAVIGATTLTLVACGGAGRGVDKAGGTGPTVTLRLGTPDNDGHPDSPAIKYFTQQVAQLSDGKLRIEVVFSVANDVSDFEPATAKLVHDGKFDLGWIGSRAWDTQGVLSFQALQAPFLITDYGLLDRVLASPVAGQMLAGLTEIGMVGLGLYPDELRHPVGFGTAFLSLADFRHARIRIAPSNVADQLIRALGAEPVHLNGPALGQAIDDGRLRGTDSSTGAPFIDAREIMTGNITFYPKTNTLFADADRFSELSREQQQQLRTAAEHTFDFASHREPEQQSAESFCAAGGTIVAASGADVADIVRAGRTIYSDLERDAGTKSAIEQIQDMKRTAPKAAPPPKECAP
jgi:TRAP-type C4-dicarboxylate transport system substrate-binding protein